AVVAVHDEAAVALDDAIGGAPLMELDAARDEVLGDALGDLDVEAAEDRRAAADDDDLGPEPTEDAREFERDVAAPDDDDALGGVGEVEDLVGGDAELGAGDLGAVGSAARGDEDALGRDAAAIDVDRVRIDESPATSEGLDAGAVEQAAVDAVESGDDGVLLRDELRHGEARRVDLEAVAPSVFERLRKGRGVDEELLRDAAGVDAGAPERAVFADADARTEPSGDTRGADAGRSGAQDEEIEVERVGHSRSGRSGGETRYGGAVFRTRRTRRGAGR